MKHKQAALYIANELRKRKINNQHKLNMLKQEAAKKFKLGKILTNPEVLSYVSNADRKKLRHVLTIKPVRALSGVSVVAIMTKPLRCPHGKCAMCPGGIQSAFGDVPQSYTGKEPATRRAIRNNFDSYLQVFNRLEQYVAINKSPEKVELIIMGGTFPSCRKDYQNDFVKFAFKAMNDFSRNFYKNGRFLAEKFNDFFELPGDIGKEERIRKVQQKILKLKNKSKTSLETEQKKNERAKIRCIGLTIETRPDYAMLKHANQMLELGCTRVELGIQSVYDDALKRIERGHTVEDSVKAIKTLRDLGFKLNFHMMLGLPGVDKKKDINSLKEVFQNQNFQPDMLKLYPTMVCKGTKLYNLWKKGKFKPLNAKKAAEIISEFKRYVPEYCRIMRIQRDIPTMMTEAGVEMTNLRQLVDKITRQKEIKCRCIRCREIKDEKIGKIDYIVDTYIANDGNEFFIEASSNDRVVGFLRLRFPSETLRKEITPESALVRELHVYGAETEIGKKGHSQHKGIGKKLLKIAEDTAKTYYKKKMVVISGIGVREYYKKQGYKLEGPYMVKKTR